MLRHAAPSDMEVAFRITAKYRIYRHEYEVLTLSGELWWPVGDLHGRRVRTSEFLVEIEKGNNVYLEMLHGRIRPDVDRLPIGVDGLNARVVKGTDRDEMLARSQRGAAQLLFCGDFVYRRGSEPVYICESSNVSGPRLYDGIRVVDSYSRRPEEISRARTVGCYSYNLFRSRACEGGIFRADEIECARAVVGNCSGGVRQDDDSIAILKWDTIRTDPLNLHVEADIYWLNRVLKNTGSEDLLTSEEFSTIHRLALQDHIEWKTGAAAIVAFITWCDTRQITWASMLHEPHKYAQRAIDAIDAHCAQRGVAPLSRLDEEDDVALKNLLI